MSTPHIVDAKCFICESRVGKPSLVSSSDYGARCGNWKTDERKEILNPIGTMLQAGENEFYPICYECLGRRKRFGVSFYMGDGYPITKDYPHRMGHRSWVTQAEKA